MSRVEGERIRYFLKTIAVEREDVLFSDDNVQVDEAAIDGEMDQIKAHFESIGKRELFMDYITGRDNYTMAKDAAEKHKLDPVESYRRTAGEQMILLFIGGMKKGIYHIAYRRGINTLLHVIDAVGDGKILRFAEGNKTVILEKDGFEAVLALTEFGNQKSWLLSGWQTNKPDVSGEVGTQSTTTQFKPMFSRQESGADLQSGLSLLSDNASTDEENSSRLSVAPDDAAVNAWAKVLLPVVKKKMRKQEALVSPAGPSVMWYRRNRFNSFISIWRCSERFLTLS